MNRRKISTLFSLILLISLVIIRFPPLISTQDPDPIGYKIYGDVVEIWNLDTTYYFNKTSGIQWTEDPTQYWIKNIFAIGYYSGGEWHKIYSADELGTFNREIESDYLTYVNATLWKDFNYAGYDLRLGVRYHLKLDDEELSVIIYAKNIGTEDYPVDLGFAWIVNDIDIPNPLGKDTIFINQTDYRLDGVYDLIFKNMSFTYFDHNLDEMVTEFLPYYRIFDYTRYITLEWDENLDYTVRLLCNGVQQEARVLWMVNGGIFKSGQEKSTILYWGDAEGDYTGEHWDIGDAVFPTGITTNSTYIWILDYSTEKVYKYSMTGSYIESWDMSGHSSDPQGITTDGTNIWILDLLDDEVYKWTMVGGYVSSFDTSVQTDDPWGITTDGTNIWIVCTDNDEVYKYTMAGSYVSKFSLTAPNGNGLGITTDGTSMWVSDPINEVIYKYTMAGVYLTSWSVTTEGSGQFTGIATDGTYIWGVDASFREVYKYVCDSPPTITSATITDMDDTNNLYAMKGYYTFQVVVDDVNGASNISSVYLQCKQDVTVRFEVRATNLNTTPAYAIQTGASIIDLDSDACSWGEALTVGTATFTIRIEWDYIPDENDLELAVYVEDGAGLSAGFTDMQTDYFDVIARLVTTGFDSNATYVQVSGGVELFGYVRYCTTVDGVVASTSYPPDAEFVAVHIHDSTDVSVGNDATIVDGYFSVEFNIPGAVQANVYHVYLDMGD